MTYSWEDMKALMPDLPFRITRRVWKLTLPDVEDAEGAGGSGLPSMKTPDRQKRASQPPTLTSAMKKKKPSVDVAVPTKDDNDNDSSSSAEKPVSMKTTRIKFPVFRSEALIKSLETGVLHEKDRALCMQITVENMRSMLCDKGQFRDPNLNELEEVAKQLCLTYHVLCERNDKEGHHVSFKYFFHPLFQM